MKAENVATESNQARAMELEAQMFEAERSRPRQSWRENTLEADIAEAEGRERRDEIKGEDNVRLLAEKRWDFTTLVYLVDKMAGQEVCDNIAVSALA